MWQPFKAVFFDDWNEETQKKVDVECLNDFTVCWVAPNSTYRAKSKELRSLKIQFKGFEVIHLTSNLRNSKEIVMKANNIAETQLYEYAPLPPMFSPFGPPPVYVSSFGEAVYDARMSKVKIGFLLVTDVNFPVLPNEKVKFFHSLRNDFQDDNPCEFLRQGNILIVSRNHVSGFEWPVVVYETGKTRVEEDLEHHDCNILMRCTTKLYIIGPNSDSNRFE